MNSNRPILKRNMLVAILPIFLTTIPFLLGFIPSAQCLTIPTPPKVSPPTLALEGLDGSLSALKMSTSKLESPGPLRITCLTIGSRGDVEPYLALCKGLINEGHICKIGTHPEFQSMIESHGIEFANLGGSPAELMKHVIEYGIFSVSFWTKGYTKFSVWLKDLLQKSGEAAQGSDILIESPSAMVGAHIAESLKIPYYRAFTMPWTKTSEYPHAFAVPQRDRGPVYNKLTYSVFDWLIWGGISRHVNNWRMKKLGLGPITYSVLKSREHPFLYNFSDKVVAKPRDWKKWVHLTGYWHLDDDPVVARKAAEAQIPEGLSTFINTAKEEKKKIVYIGFGSVIVPDPKEMTRVITEAVRETGVRAVVSGGWTAKDAKNAVGGGMEEDLKKFSKDIFYVSSVPHKWLFSQMDAAVHHGGAGSTGASMRAGIPTIIRPFFGDQKFWAQRVKQLGIGSSLQEFNKKTLSAALKSATQDEDQIRRAAQMGVDLRNENGVENAIQTIYRELPYAKSLAKQYSSPYKTREEIEAALTEPKRTLLQKSMIPIFLIPNYSAFVIYLMTAHKQHHSH